MFVGHAFLAIALGGSLATWFGLSRSRALQFGLLAGVFALIPDIDILLAVAGTVQADPTGIWTATAAFWEVSRTVHRAVTHSLVLAVPAAVGFALAAGDRPWRIAALGPLLGLVWLGWTVEGPLTSVMLLLFVGAGVVAAVGAARLSIPMPTVLAAASIGLVTHPFGDLFTGTPPPLLYPLEIELIGERVVLLADPTLNLLAVFGLELATIWFGLGVIGRLAGWSVIDAVDRRAVIGGLYGLAIFVLPPPTLETSYHFVFSVLAVGSLGAVPMAGLMNRQTVARAVATGLAGVSVAVVTYTIVYVGL